FVSALPLLFSCRLAAAEALPHVRRQVLERVSDRKFFHRIPRLGIGRESLPQLLRATESTTQRKIFSQRIAFAILLPHEDPSQIGMPDEANPEHVEALALEPIRGFIDRPDAGNFQRPILRELCLHS